MRVTEWEGNHHCEDMDTHVVLEPVNVGKRSIPCKPMLSIASLGTRTDNAYQRRYRREHILFVKREHHVSTSN
jgi:hypothetical protein